MELLALPYLIAQSALKQWFVKNQDSQCCYLFQLYEKRFLLNNRQVLDSSRNKKALL